MGDEPAAFDGVNKSGRRFLSPSHNHFRCRQTVEGVVDFDGWKLSGVKLKLFRLRHLFRIKRLVPAFVGPPARTDIYLRFGLHVLLDAKVIQTYARQKL